MSARKRIVVLASTFPRWRNDTVPPFVLELSRRLAKDADVTVLCPHYPGAKTRERMHGVRVIRYRYFIERYQKLAGSGGIVPTIKRNPFYLLQVPFMLAASFLSLRKLVKRQRPDIIHAHWVIPQGLVAAVAKKLYTIPFVVTSHGSDVQGLRQLNALKRFVLRNSTAATVVSNALKKELRAQSCPTEHVSVLPMGIDTALFSPTGDRESLRKQYAVRGPMLLYVGRLAPEKGLNHLIDAMVVVRAKHPAARLLVIGSGPMLDAYRSQVARLGLGDAVTFIGAVRNSDLPSYYTAADVYVCPSIREGLGLTAVEASSCGCVVVATTAGGLADIVKNGKTGFTVRSGSAASLAKTLLYALAADTTSIQSAARAHAVEHFDWDSIAKKYYEVLT